jgi:predicted RNase H-like HicB family nuclease
MPLSSTKIRRADSGAKCRHFRAAIRKGETVDELKGNIREAISGVLEELREQGREPDGGRG